MFLRLGTGIALIIYGIANQSAANLIAAAAGIFLLAGLWTPMVGAVIALDEVWIAFSHSQSGDLWTHILLAILGAGLAVLGPGAFSIDARIFGRKLFVNGNRKRGGNRHP